MKNLKYIIVLVLLTFIVYGYSQNLSNPKITISEEIMDNSLRIILNIPKGTYTYISSPYAQPIKLIMKKSKIYNFGKPILPKGKVKNDEKIIEGKQVIIVPFEIISKKGSNISIQYSFSYQLCDIKKGVCFPPEKIIRNYGNRKLEQITKKQIASKKAERKKTFTDKIKELIAKNLKNPIITFLLAVLGGFLASLTPCVYPIIPITVGYFANKSEKEHAGIRHRLMTAFVYVLGMGLVYTLLGVIAGIAGTAFGSLTNTPGFFIFVSVIFYMLSLSLFDVFEIKMPSALNSLKSKQGKGFAGTFLMGIITGLVASPCVGPIILFLLTGVMQAGKPLYGAVLMGGFSIGMGFLFMLLAMFSQAASKLPKSGNWMIIVKAVFGSLVLASAFYFIELAVKVLFLPIWVFWVIISVLLILSGVLGILKLNKLHGKESKLKYLFILLLVLVLAFNILTFSTEKLKWTDDYKTVFNKAKIDRKPIFMDLYADWCAICKKMEIALIKQKKLLSYLEKNYHTVKINYDLHKSFLEKNFGVKSLPWILILSNDRSILWKKAGFTDENILIDELKTVLPKYVIKKN